MTDTPRWMLEVLAGPALGKKCIALTGVLAIGRGPDNDLILPKRAVARQHALIETRRDGSVWLTDLGSRGGTVRNRRALAARQPVRLDVGDVIGIGPWRFMLDTDAESRHPVALDEPAHGDTVVAAADAHGALAAQRLKLLLDFAARQVEVASIAILLELLADYALAGSGYRRSVIVARPVHGQPRVLCQRPAPAPGDAPVRLSATLLKAAEGQDMAVLEAPSRDRLKRSLLDAELKRALCVALPGDCDPPLFLYLDTDFMDAEAQADAPALCHALTRLVGPALRAIEQRDSEQRRIALEAELDIAREIQARIAPASHGAHGELGYALLVQPGGAVAGDLADVFALPDGSLAVLLGDVSGTGLGAGLLMASVQAYLRAAMEFDADPAAVLTRLNAHLLRQASGGRFVTLWLGVFSAEGRGYYVDAGHSHALRFGHGVEALNSRGGIPLGVVPESNYQSEAIELAPGDGLLLYSDGVIEQENVGEQPFGKLGVLHAIDLDQPPAPMLLRIVDALDEHRAGAPVEDDVALLVVRRAS
ncbi:MAG TPA: SpoIIE family protein phosphatase [Xanthomonadaceae bacterium]|nr:SpoIIE family protein phosphatase [Xanthomonadaceae bacterium]